MLVIVSVGVDLRNDAIATRLLNIQFSDVNHIRKISKTAPVAAVITKIEEIEIYATARRRNMYK